ncbi:MAG: branched-chain amino acid ABC transporter permease [Candidatus Limiplasma sp.]|nr:branched-chain amino acid ABC transporter permease [Candidatus Limiplasma sp.]
MPLNYYIQQLMNGVSKGAVYALIAVGFALIFSVLKFSNFAHGGLISVCAFVGYYFYAIFKVNAVVSVLLTAIVGAVLGVLVDTVAFRRLRKKASNKIYYFISSITCSILCTNILTLQFGTTFYSIPPFFAKPTFKIGSVIFMKMNLTILIVTVVLLIALSLMLNRTKLGLSIRVASMDRDTSMLMGINPDIVIVTTFLIAGALAGVSGIFFGSTYTVTPSIGNIAVKGFVASVIGGLGSLPGAIIGAFLLGILEVALTVVVGDLITPAIIFVMALLFLLVRPEGISGKYISEKA